MNITESRSFIYANTATHRVFFSYGVLRLKAINPDGTLTQVGGASGPEAEIEVAEQLAALLAR